MKTNKKTKKPKQNQAPPIVIIDPLAEHGQMIENTLRLAGHEVKLTRDSRQAANLCRSLGANAAITCLYMEGQGLGTVEELHDTFPTLSILAFCTSPGATNLAGTARVFGAARAVRESAQPRDLVIAVEEMLL